MVAILVENLHFISKLEVIFAQKGGGSHSLSHEYHYSPFIDVETDTQKAELTCLTSHTSWDFTHWSACLQSCSMIFGSYSASSLYLFAALILPDVVFSYRANLLISTVIVLKTEDYFLSTFTSV